ncbi:angiopoietin-1 receptor-like [Patiria miniata]|uniref:receptor protein-tyrosine kinase n=1 Tax=Patiria miniata TaxID=46514 RepID=A0A914AZW8_PATMI|nr:angiopoietin-1 receptor-like [Patiria miniata]
MASQGGVCRHYTVFLLLLFLVFTHKGGLALNLRNKPTAQSTDYASNFRSGKAVDGDRGTLAHTLEAPNQWWRVDLEANYCLTKITVVNRNDVEICPLCPLRLEEAVVRAGLSSDIYQNTPIGDPVTRAQAEGLDIDFIVDPVVFARYVSVELNKTEYLALAEVMVEVIQDNQEAPTVASGVDFTLVANPARLGATGNNGAYLGAFKSPTDIAAAVSFGRQLTTGGSNDNLPTGSYERNGGAQLGCTGRYLSLPQDGGIDRTGVFYGTAALNGMATTIRTVILRKDGTIHTRPVQQTQTASIGESVTLRMESVNPPNSNYRWKHNADSVRKWDGMLSVAIGNVSKANEGIYSCFIDGAENQQRHGFMRLIVRECAAGMWGPSSCQNTCRRCYNGGICDDKTGTCICAPGFSGEYCQQVHGRHAFGQNPSHICSSTDVCRGRLFCSPDPYGCSCAAGYMGLDCMQDCTEGKYGADCKQTCHCPSGDSCEKDTGECTGYCTPPYFGSNCQCSSDNGVLGLKVISDDPHQLQVTWQPDPCVSGYILEYALTNRGQCEEIESPQRVSLPGPLDGQTTSHVITGLISSSTYMVYIRPQYNGTQGPEASTSGTTLTEIISLRVMVTSYDSASVTLSWREVYCANYSVQYALQNKEGCETIDPLNFTQHCMCSGTNSTVIPGLFANSMYEIRVNAYVDGSYGPTTQLTVITGTQVPSAPPQQVTVTSTTKSSLTFSWSQPACGSRGGIITSYSYKLSGPGSQLILDVSTAEQVEIDGLIPFTNYSFQVAANTSVGAGPYSDVVDQRTDEAKPTAPLNVVIQNIDDVSITLKWSEPNPPQGIITNYNVRYWRSGQSGTPTLIYDVVQVMHEITGLETGVTYFLQVQAHTSVGAGPWSNEVTAMTTIRDCIPPYFGRNCQCSSDNGVLGLNVFSDDPHQLHVSWQPDACVSGYILEYALTNRGQCEDIESPQRVSLPGPLDGQTTSHVITGLISRSTYKVCIRPQYNGTQGPEESTSGTTLTEIISLQVMVTSYDSASVTLSWREVYCANYSVQYALQNKEGCETIDPLNFTQHCMCSGTNSTVIPGLFANSMYGIRVNAYVDGSYGPTTQLSVITGTQVPFSPPQQVTVTSTSKSSLTFSWSQPACGSRGGIITGYSYKLSGPGSQLILDVSTAEQVEIDGLIPFTNYSFQVAANTSAGAGPYSDVVIQRTDEAKPTVPLNVVIQNIDDVSITLKWSEPNPPQGIISNYNVRYWRSGQSGTPTLIYDVVQVMHEITGLETGVTYFLQVQAQTSVGAGPWSNEVTAMTTIREPGPIQYLHWTDRTEYTIILDWEPPLNPNGQIQRYIVEYRATDKPHQPGFTSPDEYERNEVESPPFVKENLEPGTKYEFRVAAENQLFKGSATVLEAYTKPPSDLHAPPQPISYQGDATDTTVTIGITTAVSGDDFIESYVVHVKKTRSSSVTRRDVLIPSHFEDSPSDYITAELPNGGVPDRFVVGDTNMYGGYYNAPLQTGAVYNIRVGSVSKGNESVANVEFSEPLTIKVERPSSNPGPIIAAVVISIGLLVVLLVAAFILWKKRSAARSQQTATDELALSENPKPTNNNLESLHADNNDPDVYEVVAILPIWASELEIKWDNFIIDDEILGKGNFGEVRAGCVKIKGQVTKAAIKTIKGNAHESAWEDFMKELRTMTGIEPHPNVVGLLGACMHEAILYVALEFLPNGNLRDYLRSTRPKQQGAAGSQDDVSPLTSSNLLKFSLDVAKGMEHLSNTGIIHRDLAARNILLSEDLTAKVSDFGLSRGEEIYVQKSSTGIPVRWLAIESLTRRVYKSKSDVWSFGILLWEIVTFGSTPYPGIDNKSLVHRLLDGYRMPKPENCADEIYDVMLKCWHVQPSNRPSFSELVEILEEMTCNPDVNDYLSPTVYYSFTIKPEFDDN